jgi:hypothetical protein
MKKFKPLGILYYKNEVVNHRSILKVFLNPFLMMFGLTIASKFKENIFFGYIFISCECHLNLIENFNSHFFTCNDYDRVEKRKIFL